MFLINGQFTETVSAQDRGLHYGDGLFETIAVVDGEPLCWEEHYQRLQAGCGQLGLICPPEELLRTETTRLPPQAARQVLKIMVTRGQGGRGYRPPPSPAAGTRILGLYPWPDYPPERATAGVRMKICATRLGHNPRLAGIKHLNRLEQVLARSEWQEEEIAEGLMLDTDGAVISGTMSNLFCLKDNILATPDLAACGIAGVIRTCILRHARDTGMQCTVGKLTESDLSAADELFVCNSIIGVWPCRALGDRVFTPGPGTRAIRAALLQKQKIAP